MGILFVKTIGYMTNTAQYRMWSMVLEYSLQVNSIMECPVLRILWESKKQICLH